MILIYAILLFLKSGGVFEHQEQVIPKLEPKNTLRQFQSKEIFKKRFDFGIYTVMYDVHVKIFTRTIFT